MAYRWQLPTVHDDCMDLHGVDDSEGHCVREGAASEGSDEGDGTEQCESLAGLVHHLLHHDVPQCPPTPLCPQGEYL